MPTLQSIGLGAIVSLALAVALLFYVGAERTKAYDAGYAARGALVSSDNAATVTDNLKAREKSDEIRQVRPADAYYIDRWMRGGA